MSILLKLSRIYIPGFYKSRIVTKLIDITADSFGKQPPSTSGLNHGETLELFARYSCSVAEEALKTGADISKIESLLYEKSQNWGSKVRKFLRIRDIDDILAAEKLLYEIIGIDFIGNKTGEFRIDRCYFSNMYSPATCIIFSHLDRGIAAGISGGRLLFESRITEGDSCCRGRFYFNES